MKLISRIRVNNEFIYIDIGAQQEPQYAHKPLSASGKTEPGSGPKSMRRFKAMETPAAMIFDRTCSALGARWQKRSRQISMESNKWGQK
jgi:hypothetical protein